MKILITMSGEGSRFKKIGFKVPKHEIIANGKSLFEWSMISLEDFFDEDFIFIVREGNYNKKFMEEKCKDLGINSYSIFEINALTDGQASTALMADELINDNEAVSIFNIDTFLEAGAIEKNQILENYEGFIPSFVAEGDKWSFVKIDENNKVHEVSEKVRISEYGTIGFYYFKSWAMYKDILTSNKEEIIENYKEAYIAPMYKYMIENQKGTYASIVEGEKIHVLGTPDDILEFAPNYLQENKMMIEENNLKDVYGEI